MPQLLRRLGHKVGQARVDVAGRDAVDARKVAPFVGEGFGEVDAAGFGDVVRGLKPAQGGELVKTGRNGICVCSRLRRKGVRRTCSCG
jgi:hypothetical protein